MMTRRIRSPLTLVLVFAFGLSACSTDDTFLRALLADPMASYEADEIELIDRDSRGYRAERPFAQPAEVTSIYRVINESQAELVLQEAVASAEAGGWEMRQSPTIPNRYEGVKELSVGEGRLIVVTAPEEEEVGQRLHILLGFASIDELAE